VADDSAKFSGGEPEDATAAVSRSVCGDAE